VDRMMVEHISTYTGTIMNVLQRTAKKIAPQVASSSHTAEHRNSFLLSTDIGFFINTGIRDLINSSEKNTVAIKCLCADDARPVRTTGSAAAQRRRDSLTGHLIARTRHRHVADAAAAAAVVDAVAKQRMTSVEVVVVPRTLGLLLPEPAHQNARKAEVDHLHAATQPAINADHPPIICSNMSSNMSSLSFTAAFHISTEVCQS